MARGSPLPAGTDRLISLPQALELLGITRSRYNALVNALAWPIPPAPQALTKQARFRLSDVLDYIEHGA